jgi:hypothetical protein
MSTLEVSFDFCVAWRHLPSVLSQQSAAELWGLAGSGWRAGSFEILLNSVRHIEDADGGL